MDSQNRGGWQRLARNRTVSVCAADPEQVEVPERS
jgi:hypothetical protein